MPVSHIKKRSGKRVLFNEHKITDAVLKAMHAAGVREDEKAAQDVTKLVVRKLNRRFKDSIPTIEDVQDLVEEALLELRHTRVAKEYILYRNERAKVREQKAALIGGKVDDVELSLNAIKLLEQRYLLRDDEGKVVETPSEMFWRVANNVARAEIKLKEDAKSAARTYYRLMSNLEFLPASPTMMNAGTARQMAPCFAIPIPDDIDSIFKALYQAAVIQKNGGGTGFSFSRVRERGDTAEGLPSVAAGPLAYMRVFEAGMKAVKQSGRRQGANMAVLRVDHPDILDFINMKLTRKMENFNISVGITDAFMRALEANEDYELISPRTGKPVGSAAARVVFDSILAVSWRTGDPGLIFLDRLNQTNTCPHIGQVETTSACGEQPLLPYESCCEGSINLTRCLKEKEDSWQFEYQKLRRIVGQAVRFLDDLIDANNYPVKEVETMTKKTRKIGLGIMGFADVCYALRVPYDSEEAEELAGKIMSVIRDEAEKTSESLADERGTFPAWRRSRHERQGKRRRNATLLCIAPTGTISLIASVSSGIEPNYALSFSRTVVGGSDLLHVNPWFEDAIRNNEKDIVQEVAKRGMILDSDNLPEDIKRVFKTAQQITPEWHVRIQAAFQKHVDGAISKTINFPEEASVGDIEEAMVLAWKLGCNGITVYRDSSLDEQVITAGSM